MSNFKEGEKVIYSDLSPWEVCTILEKSDEPDFDWYVQFGDDEPIHVQEDGMRKYTLENMEKYL